MEALTRLFKGYNEPHKTLTLKTSTKKVGVFLFFSFKNRMPVAIVGAWDARARLTTTPNGSMKMTNSTNSNPKIAHITLVATHCACCGRPLKDATSVDFGVGPICRGKYLYEDALPVTEEILDATRRIVEQELDSEIRGYVWNRLVNDDSRAAANQLVKFIAVHQKDSVSMPALRILKLMGYTELVTRVEKRIKAAILITIEDDVVTIESPYNRDFVNAIRNIKGRRYNREDHTNSVPVSQKRALWTAMLTHFEGSLGKGPKGPFVIEKES